MWHTLTYEPTDITLVEVAKTFYCKVLTSFSPIASIGHSLREDDYGAKEPEDSNDPRRGAFQGEQEL